MKARIYQEQKKSMQSGYARTGRWVLEVESDKPKTPDPLMGWVTGDTIGQVSLTFDTKDDAVKFAQEKGYLYSVTEGHKRRIPPKNYTDNFRYREEEA